jgi:hypothetical protein
MKASLRMRQALLSKGAQPALEAQESPNSASLDSLKDHATQSVGISWNPRNNVIVDMEC